MGSDVLYNLVALLILNDSKPLGDITKGLEFSSVHVNTSLCFLSTVFWFLCIHCKQTII